METSLVKIAEEQAAREGQAKVLQQAEEQQFFNCLDFLHELYLKTNKGEQFNLTELNREYGFTDGRMLDFLQDVNVVKNIGGNGKHAKWVWNCRITPSITMAKKFLSRFEVYKYNQTVAANKDPKEFNLFPALDEPEATEDLANVRVRIIQAKLEDLKTEYNRQRAKTYEIGEKMHRLNSDLQDTKRVMVAALSIVILAIFGLIGVLTILN